MWVRVREVVKPLYRWLRCPAMRRNVETRSGGGKAHPLHLQMDKVSNTHPVLYSNAQFSCSERPRIDNANNAKVELHRSTFNLLTSSLSPLPRDAGTVETQNGDPTAPSGAPWALGSRRLLALAVRLVSRLVHEREELRVLVGLDLGEPAVLLGRLVQERRLVTESLVDLDNLARQRGVDVRSGLDRLDGADGLCGR